MATLLQQLYHLARPVLFRVEPELAHRVTDFAMRFLTPILAQREFYFQKPKIIFDRKIVSPLGVAAGFDKYCRAPRYLFKLGFGFIESGSLTPQPQLGNPRPRLLRIPEHEALLNKMGFNNPGLLQGWKSLRHRIAKLPKDHLVALSLGKGKNTPLEKAADDYRWCLEQLAGDPMAEFIFYVAINISSPNTPGLRALQHFRMLRQLVATCKQVAPRPLLVKLAPDFASEKEFYRTLAAAFEGGAQGAIICNTTTDHRLLPPALQNFGGGLSGKPLADRARQLLKIAARETRGQWPLISSGGVFSPEEAKKRLDWGADLVQVYTGLIYYGPDFAADLGKYPKKVACDCS